MNTVVLDANELQSDWMCTGLKFQLLRHRPFDPPLRVYVPALVVEEVVANHARETQSSYTELNRARRKLKRLGVPQNPAATDSKFDYREYLVERFDEVLAIDVLDWPEVPHSELVARAVNRIPPFNANGGGYRDALIWHDVMTLARSGSSVAFVTNDRAFYENAVVSSKLAEEVATFGGRVELVKDFGSWLLAQLPWPETDLKNAVARGRDQEFYAWFYESDMQDDLVPDVVDLGFIHTPYSAKITEVAWDGTIENAGVRISPDGAVLVEYDVGELVQFEAEFPEGSDLEEDWQVASNVAPGRVIVSGEISMVVRTGVLFNADEWTVDQLAWRRSDGRSAGAGPLVPNPNQLALWTAQAASGTREATTT